MKLTADIERREQRDPADPAGTGNGDSQLARDSAR